MSLPGIFFFFLFYSRFETIVSHIRITRTIIFENMPPLKDVRVRGAALVCIYDSHAFPY